MSLLNKNTGAKNLGAGKSRFGSTTKRIQLDAEIGTTQTIKDAETMKVVKVIGKAKILNNVFEIANVAKAFRFQLTGGIVGETGRITVAGETLSLVLATKNKDKIQKAVLSVLAQYKKDMNLVEGFRNPKYKGVAYKSLLKRRTETIDGIVIEVVEVNKADLKQIKYDMIHCDLDNLLNLVNICMDLNDILRLYQETVIDAAKTGEFLELELLVKGIRDALHLGFVAEVIEEKIDTVDEVTGKAVVRTVKNVRLKREEGNANVDYNQTDFSALQDKWASLVGSFTTKFLNTVPDYSPSYLLKLNLLKKETKGFDKIMNAKKMYSCVTANYVAASKAEEKGRVDKSKKPEFSSASLEMDHGCALLSQYVRTNLKGLSIADTVDIVKAASWSSSIDSVVNPQNTNKFLFNVIEQEYLIDTNEGDTVELGYKIAINKGLKNGDYAIFMNNFDNVTGSLLASKTPFNGMAKISNVEEVLDKDGNVIRYKGGYAVVSETIEIPSYKEEEVVFFLTSQNEIKISLGDAIEIDSERTNVLDANGNTKTCKSKGGNFYTEKRVAVKGNGLEIADLYYSINNESYLLGLKGNVVDFVCTKDFDRNGNFVAYKAIVKVNKTITREELEEVVAPTQQVEENEYFQAETQGFFGVSFFNGGEEACDFSGATLVDDEPEIIVNKKITTDVQADEDVVEPKSKGITIDLGDNTVAPTSEEEDFLNSIAGDFQEEVLDFDNIELD